MKKIGLFLSSILLAGMMIGCSNGQINSEEVNKLQLKIEQLEREKSSFMNQLSTRVLNETESNVTEDDTVEEGIKRAIDGFLKAQYNYTNPSTRVEKLKEYITSDMLNYFDNQALNDTDGTTVEITSKLESYDIYRIIVDEQTASATVEITTSFQVQDNAAVESTSLLVLSFEKDSTGNYLASNQEVSQIIK